jgi:hypothetical protein
VTGWVLRDFSARALELHADGAVTSDSVADYLLSIVNAVDL